jgi:SPP1 gp7 family putative phage head morphogenesis protein
MENKIIKAFAMCFNKSPEDVVEYLDKQGIKITWDWQEQLDAIKKHCFTVAKISSADILELIKSMIDKAVAEGKTFREFKRELFAELQLAGYGSREDGSAWRLDTIYRTNLQSAYMAGRYKQMMEVKEEFPYWEFVAVKDNRTTDGCNNLNGVLLPLDDAFWTTNYPPRHYRCRSRVRAVSEFQMQKRNISVSDSEQYADVKPSKGFETNPGEWQPDLSKYSTNVKKTLSNIMEAYK